MRLKISDFMAVDTGLDIIITLRISRAYKGTLEAFKARFKPKAEYELKECRKKRSLDANNFLWQICHDIAQTIGSTKEEVYREAISHVGVFDVMQFTSNEAMQRFKMKWMANGEGWLTKTLDADKRVLMAYYGSSRYDTKEMSVLIDYLVEEAKSMGIEYLTEAEIDLIKREWK